MIIPVLRPSVRFLPEQLVARLLSEAGEVLREVGVEVAHPEAADILMAAGASGERSPGRIRIPSDLIDRALATAPRAVRLYGRDGSERADLGGDRVHFTPGSAAIHVLDEPEGTARAPVTRDYVRYARLVEQLPSIDYPSTALIPSDVPETISDAYRLYLSLVNGSGPVVTGAFSIGTFSVMADLLIAVRGGAAQLASKPLAVFSCCPTAPLKWSEVTSKNLIDCARARIPVEIVSMPLTGFVAPGTLVGTLVQHAAENLSGVVLSQAAMAGTPVIWGGSPAIFDYRHETTPMGAVESQMLNCASSEIGRSLGLPTQGYIGPSDSKRLDAQAGLESGAGTILAALSGINSVSGPGMLDFESCQSLEKLVLDAEICAMAKRLALGVEEREGDFPSIPHFEALLEEGHTIITGHTRRWFRREVRFPGPVIDRMAGGRYRQEGSRGLLDRARLQVEELLAAPPNLIDPERRRALDAIMLEAARGEGLDRLPAQEM